MGSHSTPPPPNCTSGVISGGVLLLWGDGKNSGVWGGKRGVGEMGGGGYCFKF